MKIVAMAASSILALLVIGAIYMLGSPAIPQTSSYHLDLGQLRQIGHEVPGNLPVRLNAAVEGELQARAAFVLGGLRLDLHRMVFPAYQVVYSDGAIVVDASSREFLSSNPMAVVKSFDEKQFNAVEDALPRARAIVVTHEHDDHIGGISRSPKLAEFRDRLMLTREQIEDRKWLDVAAFPESVRSTLKPLEFDHYKAIAPGVVLIKAPGHTIGSQIVYVQLANGAEYLLVGDVAWDMEQIREPKCRPRIASRALGEDASQVGAELRTLHQIAEGNPAVHIVVSHDGVQLSGYQDSGLIGKSFE